MKPRLLMSVVVLLPVSGRTHDLALDLPTGGYVFQCVGHAAVGMTGTVNISNRAFAQRVAQGGTMNTEILTSRYTDTITVADIMTQDVWSVTPQTLIAELVRQADRYRDGVRRRARGRVLVTRR